MKINRFEEATGSSMHNIAEGFDSETDLEDSGFAFFGMQNNPERVNAYEISILCVYFVD